MGLELLFFWCWLLFGYDGFGGFGGCCVCLFLFEFNSVDDWFALRVWGGVALFYLLVLGAVVLLVVQGCMRCFDFGCIEVCGYGWCLVAVWVLVIIDLRFVGCLFGVCAGLIWLVAGVYWFLIWIVAGWFMVWLSCLVLVLV